MHYGQYFIFSFVSDASPAWLTTRGDDSKVSKNNRSGARRRVTQNKSPLTDLMSNQIPPYQSDAVQSLVVRYYVNPEYANDVKSFSVELPIVPYASAYASGYATIPFKAVRIKKIEIWCNFRPDGNVVGNTINLTFLEHRTVRPLEWSDTATFLTPAHIKKKFSKNEPLGLWYSTTSGESNPEIHFQLPKGALLQITFDYVIHDGESLGVAASGSFTSFPKIYTNQLNSDMLPVGKTYAAVIAA